LMVLVDEAPLIEPKVMLAVLVSLFMNVAVTLPETPFVFSDVTKLANEVKLVDEAADNGSMVYDPANWAFKPSALHPITNNDAIDLNKPFALILV